MLKVKTYLHNSDIHGTGLFAMEDIPARTLIGKLDRVLDKQILVEDVLDEHIEMFNHYFSLQGEGRYYQTYFDNMRFMNHSDKYNCFDEQNGDCWSVTDIKKGQELTCDYNQFDELTQKNGIN